MARLTQNRAQLMLTCGSAALAISLAMVPDRAQAQAFQATEEVQAGGATRIFTGTGTETVEVQTPTAVIEWTPNEDGAGNALDFLPTGNVATFQNGVNNADFAVLNIILPSTNENVVVFDGTVISQLIDLGTGAQSSGGTVAFYSPTGIFVGGDAVFDVGNLILTTVEPDLASFDDFALNGGQLQLQNLDPLSPSIIISPGAQITATAENSYFAVVAAEIQMLGSANINGSHAYVAGEAANLTVSNGLFDIEIPIGTDVAVPVVLDGNVGGPSSTGAGDNHLIYAVARATSDPISMIFRGNLGFQPAGQAGIVNGEIILSANYGVSGRTVDGGSISDGINAEFDGNSELTSVPGSIFLEDITSTSSILAIANDEVQVTAFTGNSTIDGNLLMVGRNFAELTSVDNNNFVINGDVLVSARDYGQSGSNLDSGDADADGGDAFIDAFAGGVMTINGNVLVTADALSGYDIDNDLAGAATGGNATIASNGGSLTINGDAAVSAEARLANTLQPVGIGNVFTGGTAQFFATQGGQVTIDGALTASADATGANGRTASASTGSDAFSGTVAVQTQDGSSLTVTGNATLTANANAGSANDTSSGAVADAGEVFVAPNANGTIDFRGDLTIQANASGGLNTGGVGGNANAGAARVLVPNGGTVNVGGNFAANADAIGGNGVGGGNAFAGVAGAQNAVGLIDVQGNALSSATASGGDAFFGFGGDGGNGVGGLAVIQAEGTQTETASISIGGSAQVLADGSGGSGGLGDGAGIAAGRGGDGLGGDQNTANPAANGLNNGAFIGAGGDNGSLTVSGATQVSASGLGGSGGNGGLDQAGGEGGQGRGGDAVAGLMLFGTDGSVGNGSATFNNLSASADGTGGNGGFGGSTFDPEGDGGNGLAGSAVIMAAAGDLIAGGVQTFADGRGGNGANGGDGTGAARSGAVTSDGGTITFSSLEAGAIGVGGAASSGLGGAGQGGLAALDFQDGTTQINGDVTLDASGFGGFSADDDGAEGTGGDARITNSTAIAGDVTVTGHASVLANGIGGETVAGFTGGTGLGGRADLGAEAGGTITLGSAQIVASGLGGAGDGADAGEGIGGDAMIDADGAASTITIQTSTPVTQVDPALTQGRSLLAANGIGAGSFGGSGVGGNGTGGTATIVAIDGGAVALPADPAGDANQAGVNLITARGVGGGSGLAGGVGGEGAGGVIDVIAQAGSITSGVTDLSILGLGGSSLDTDGNIDGGLGIGGSRIITITNGGAITAEFGGGLATAIGGNGSGTGDGGDAEGGENSIIVDAGTLTVVGDSTLTASATGGTGTAGGNALGGSTTLTVRNGSAVNFVADAGGASSFTIGGETAGGQGVDQGGSASQGEAVSIEVADSAITGTGSLSGLATARGGTVTDPGGAAGNADGGSVFVSVTNSDISLGGINTFSADATGGTDGAAGNATAGSVAVEIVGSDVSIVAANSSPGLLDLTANGFGGTSQVGIGDSTGGSVDLLVSGGSFVADQINGSANASSSGPQADIPGGRASAGSVNFNLNGLADIDLGTLSISADAFSAAQGTTRGGSATLVIGSLDFGGDTQVDVADVDISADAAGAMDTNTDVNTVGIFRIIAIDGDLRANNVTATALGDVVRSGGGGLSSITADGGNIRVVDTMNVDLLEDIEIRTAQASIIGGPIILDPTAIINVQSQGTINILGDDDNFIGFGGLEMTLTSRDIAIENGARIGASTVNFVSLDDTAPAILGGPGTPAGDVTGEGYTAIAEELNRIEAETFTFVQPTVIGSGDNDPDLIVRDVTAAGVLDDGVSNVLLEVDGAEGIVRIEGNVALVDADTDSTFSITADERIEVVTPGGIAVLDPDGNPTGSLFLGSNNIWVADDNFIALLQDNRSFTGRDDQLSMAAGGIDDPLGFIRAGGVEIEVGQSLLVRNTGTATAQGGILVGDGGLLITAPDSGPNNGGAGLDVFAYGARRDSTNGTLVTGEGFFNEVVFDDGSAVTVYTDQSEFNDCIINTGVCSSPSPGPEPEPEPENPFDGDDIAVINNPIVIEASVTTTPNVPPTARETNDSFGIDFPGLLEEPEEDEEGNIDDPVSSGGDSSLYGSSGTVRVEGN